LKKRIKTQLETDTGRLDEVQNVWRRARASSRFSAHSLAWKRRRYVGKRLRQKDREKEKETETERETERERQREKGRKGETYVMALSRRSTSFFRFVRMGAISLNRFSMR
jgi:hypothetical protein